MGDIVLQLDDTTAKGMLGVADFAAKALRFDLNVDRINADRYLPPPAEKPAEKDAAEAADADSGGHAAHVERSRPAASRRGDLRRHQIHQAAAGRERTRRQGPLPSVRSVDVWRQLHAATSASMPPAKWRA